MPDGEPLRGKRIVVTRPRHQAASLSEKLRALGAEVIEAPAIRIEPPEDFQPLDDALDRIASYDWIVFTSVNGVTAFFDRGAARALERPGRRRTRFAAIGPATADALTEHGVEADLVPERFIAEAVFDAMATRGEVAGKRILLPRADIARETLPRLLREAGAEVEVVAAYRTVADDEELGRARALIEGEGADVVTFTSGSTVRSFFGVVDPALLAGPSRAASIGPITTRALEAVGVPVAIEADPYTIDGLVQAILRFFAATGGEEIQENDP